MLKTLINNRAIIVALTKREIQARYKGSILGILWTVIYPLIMLGIYTFVYSVIFKAKWGTGAETTVEFALVLFIGIILYNFFVECISRSSSIILSQVNYVKKIVFPLEVLPVTVLGSALFHMAISFVIWIIFYVILYKSFPPATIIFLPVVILPLFLFILSAAWFLSAAGVYLRDLPQIIALLMSVLIFITPIFYPLSAVPVHYQFLFYLNPLTFILEQARDILIWGKMPHWSSLLLITIAYIGLTCLSFKWFQINKKGFADVI